jgi:phosphohistidine phosphatase
MKTLLLIRHAKAEPPAAGVVDHDRPSPSADDGMRRDGQATRAAEPEANRMISSTAARAAATARLIGDELGLPPQGHHARQPALRQLGEQDALSHPGARRQPGLRSAGGHNPEMTELAQHFAPDSPTWPPAQCATRLRHRELVGDRCRGSHAWCSTRRRKGRTSADLPQ